MGHQEIVTQQDVAERAGVSRSVVSYVLNNGPRKVSDETRQRVLDAIKDLGYRPNEHAQRLRIGSGAARNSIGVVAGGKGYNILERPYYNTILSSLFDSAHYYGQHVRFFSFWDALKDPIYFNKNIHEDQISSLILILPSFILEDAEDEQLLLQTIERVENIVCLENSILDLPAVIFDRAAAARMAVSHLIKLGHERIAFLAIDDQRLVGYRQTLLEYNLPYDASLVRFLHPTQPARSAYDITSDLIDLAPAPTALFAANDESAIGAMAAIQDRGMRVPDDIAIISIDNIEMSSLVRPALSTINVPRQTIASYAIQFLMAHHNFPDRQPASMVLPIELIVRDSCGANRV